MTVEVHQEPQQEGGLDLRRSEITNLAIEVLLATQEGEIITWEALDEGIGMDARKAGKPYVESARRILRNDGRAAFWGVGLEGIGLRRLTPGGVAQLTTTRRRKVRNQGRYITRELHVMADRTQEMTRGERNEAMGNLLLAEALKQQTAHAASRRRELRVSDRERPVINVCDFKYW